MSVRGGANCRLRMTMFHFNFKSARGANYRKYGNFFPYCRFLKKRSVNDFIFASYMLLYPITTQNCRKSHSYMIFHSELFQKHSVRQKTAKTRFILELANFFHFFLRNINKNNFLVIQYL